MVSKAKLYSKFDELEHQFERQLLAHVRNAVDGSNDLIFCVKQFNPFRELKYKTDRVTEGLIDMGSQILSLREKLNEPTDGTPAARICWYCRAWGNTSNHHRASSIGLARRFLTELEAYQHSREIK